MQDKPLQIQINLNQNNFSEKAVQVQPWVNTAIDAKINAGQEHQVSQPSHKLELNMTFSQSILNRRS